jgi:ABC-type phosphate transport system ATPase subunit
VLRVVGPIPDPNVGNIKTLKKLKSDVTMIIVSHNEEPLKITDKKILIKNGRLVS